MKPMRLEKRTRIQWKNSVAEPSMFTFFRPKPCPVCAARVRMEELLREQMHLLRSQLAHSRLREEKAVDALLDRQGTPTVTPTATLSMADAAQATEDLMGFFKDEADQGDGVIQEVDRSFGEDVMRRGLPT